MVEIKEIINGVQITENIDGNIVVKLISHQSKPFLRTTNESAEETYQVLDTVGEIYNTPALATEFRIVDANNNVFIPSNGVELIQYSLKIRAFRPEDDLDEVIAIGSITTTSNSVTLRLHSSGTNAVRINGLTYEKYYPDLFNFTPVTTGEKILIIYALPDTQVFHLAQGVESTEAVEPTYSGLFVARLLVTKESVDVAELVSGFREKAVDGWKLHPVSSPAPTYLVVDESKKCNFSVVQLSSTSEINLAGISSNLLDWLYDGLQFTITNDCATDINLVSQVAGNNQKAFVLPRSPFKVKLGQSIKLYYSASQDAVLPLLLSSDAQITFDTQSEMESQTPPDTENNKAVSLFGLWKWVKKLNYLYLNITTANSTFNKIWYDGLNAWVTNKDGINKQLAYDENGVNIPQGRITTTTSITTETKTNSNLSQNGKNIIIDNGANNINLRVNAFAGGNFCATYIKDGTGTISIVAGSGVTLDLVQYTDVVNGKSGSRFMISQNGSTNTFKIFVRNYE